MEEGNIEYLRLNTETILSREERGASSRTLYMLPAEIDPDGVNDVRKLKEILDKLEKMAENHRVDQMKLIALGNISNDYVRKCTEFVFRGSNEKNLVNYGKRCETKDAQDKSCSRN